MNIVIFIILILFTFITNKLIKKKGIINNYNGQAHQKFLGNKNVPLTGGIYILLISIFVFYDFSYFFCFALIVLFLIGLASDTNLLPSPRIRFILQSISLIVFAFIFELEVSPTRIYYLDLILNNFLLSCLFSTFCLMIVINGTNFIDGSNGLVLIYYIIIIGIISKFGLHLELGIYQNKLNYFLLFLLFISVLNIFDQLYLGDSGAYVLGFITSVILISVYKINIQISPFFIILLLWYPCFENLFSIIRKFKIKRSPILADNKHLHQLLFNFLQSKIKCKKIYLNNLTSLIILSYNFIIFFLAIKNIYNTQYQITLILCNILIYTFFYLRLFNYFFKVNSK